MLLKTLFSLFLITGTAISVIAQQKNLKLLSYNIRNGKGMDLQTDYDRIAAVVKKAGADVVALQELDSVTARSKGVDVLSILAQKTAMHAVYGAAIPYNGGKYGVGILSREKPLQHYTVPLPGREEQRVLLVAEFRDFVIFCTHLSLTEEDRLASAAIIQAQAARFSKPGYLLGDLNAEPSSALLNELRKSWTLLSGEAPTFPAPEPDKCIDYILSRNSQKKTMKAEVLDEPLASDHRPVLVEVRD